MSEQTLMTFEEWWVKVYLGDREPSPNQSEAACFMLQTKEIAARAAWEAGQMVLREDFARIVRKAELVRREREKRSR